MNIYTIAIILTICLTAPILWRFICKLVNLNHIPDMFVGIAVGIVVGGAAVILLF